MEKCFEEVHEPCAAGICPARVGFVSPSGDVKSSVIHLSYLFGPHKLSGMKKAYSDVSLPKQKITKMY